MADDEDESASPAEQKRGPLPGDRELGFSPSLSMEDPLLDLEDGRRVPLPVRGGSAPLPNPRPALSDSHRRSASLPVLVPPPAEADPSAVRAAVSKEMRVFTRDGCVRLADLAGDETEVWSGHRWIEIRPEALPAPAKLYRVRLDNGACLVCAADHPWAVVVQGQIVPVLTQDLRTDFTISLPLPFDLDDLGGTGAPDAYELGAAMADAKRSNKDGLPSQVFGMGRTPLGNFVAGWMDAQKGALFGSWAAIHGLQVVLWRLGAHHTFVEEGGTYYGLGISKEDRAAIPNPKNWPRGHRRVLSTLPRIVEIYALRGTQRPYTIITSGRTIVLDGVLTLC